MRRKYLDNIRWITVLVVVVYHVVYMYNAEGIPGVYGKLCDSQPWDILSYIPYPWMMTLLFVVSGVSSRLYLENHTIKEFLKARTVKLLVPCTLGILVFQWIQGYLNMAISNSLNIEEQMEAGGASMPGPVLLVIKLVIMMLSGIGVLWYIQVLWLLSLLVALVRKFEKGRLYDKCRNIPYVVMLLFGLGMFGAAQILNTPIITVYRFGPFLFAFFMGYFVFAREEVVDRLVKFWWISGILTLVTGITYCILFWGQIYPDKPVINHIVTVLYAWFAILFLFGFMKRFVDKENAFTRFMCKEAWGIYIFHYMPLSAVACFLVKNYTLPAVLWYIISLAAALIGAYILNFVISRIPVLRFCVLGIQKKKKTPVKQ